MARKGRPTFKFELDPGAFGGKVEQILTRKMGSILRQSEAQAKTNVPVDTGNLGRKTEADPIRIVSPFLIEGSITGNTDYAAAVHEGSRPHMIRPRPGGGRQFLKFPGRDGRDVFAREVFHPGGPSRPYIRNAIEQVAGRL